MISKSTVTKALGRKKILAAAIPLIIAAQAQGLEGYVGDLSYNLNSSLSMGSSWRLEEKNSTLTSDVNGNDGDLNYDKNDAFSQVFKGSNDLEMKYQNYGAFVQVKYWYDAALENDDSLDDSKYHDLQKFSGLEATDAFVYGEFEVNNMPLDLRLGKQVLSWGESTFIPGSIDSINPFDISAFNRPGAKLKEAVIPVNMAFMNIGLTDNLSAEVFYQLDYHETVLDSCGTYFSFLDFATLGCDDVDSQFADPLGVTGDTGSLIINKDSDFVRRPDSDGQFGIAFRYYAESLDTEFGLFAMNVHSRNPVFGASYSGISATDQVNTYAAAYGNTDYQAVADSIAASVNPDTSSAEYSETFFGMLAAQGFYDVAAANLASSSYFIEYPEDTKIMGLSFATNIGSLALSGEVSHQLDVPFNISTLQTVGNLISGQLEVALSQLDPDTNPLYLPVSDPYYSTVSANDANEFKGYDLYDVTQVQVTALQLFDQVLGANSILFLAEAGFTYNHGFDEDGVTKYGGTAFPELNPATGTLYTDANGNVIIANSVTESSWGYRALVSAEYSGILPAITLTPEIYWSHDVEGVASASGSGFLEDNKRLGLSLSADYQNTYTGTVSYTRYSGGQDDSLSDRDYASISVGMQF